MNKLDAKTFAIVKREKLLNFKDYEFSLDISALRAFSVVGEALKKISTGQAEASIVKLMRATRQRAWQSTGHIANCYSAGHSIADLRAFYPSAIEYWESYATYSAAFKDSPDGASVTVGHISLPSNEYVDGLMLVCFGILLGWTNLLYRLAPIFDFRNSRDALIERLLANYIGGRDTDTTECARHLPYIKAIKIFDALPSQRPELMKEYLEDWYHASRREPYYDSHKKGPIFKGYWAWEAAAITFALDIDDSTYRDAQFYPRDLVDFAREARTAYAPLGSQPAIGELRAKAGDPCPKEGNWQSLDVEPRSQYFEAEEPMANLDSAYGLTVWKFIGS